MCIFTGVFQPEWFIFTHFFSLFDKLKNCSSGCYNHSILDCSSEHITLFSDYLLLVAKYWWQWQTRPALKTSDFLIYVQNYKVSPVLFLFKQQRKLKIRYHSWDFMSWSLVARDDGSSRGYRLLWRAFSFLFRSPLLFFSVCFSCLLQWWTDIILKLVFQCKYRTMVIRSPFIYLER